MKIQEVVLEMPADFDAGQLRKALEKKLNAAEFAFMATPPPSGWSGFSGPF